MVKRNYIIDLFCKISLLSLLVLLNSCSSQSKESYLDNYKDFISEISSDTNEYTEEEWIEMDEEYENYSGDLYDEYQEDLTFQEKMLLKKYAIQYNFFRYKEDASALINLFNKKDYDKLKEQLKYYSDNEMEADIENLKNQADKFGSEASKAFDDILKELNEANLQDED
ncbi:DUF6565 domain-containing protein [Aequorivita sp. CIP111184]|uniref:DUF6565 domain-containing protein n=1 Tax=Aequorivita sp. CIP111184 TaxID=2211356 RepID=UPI000DBBCAAF|nr:DUF6565 domain-containing protein [Aequorivita sp. CIP111184]SRX56220.1 hypothetical protein AEQU1_03250 [Aequorivita sp. CIP111184]